MTILHNRPISLLPICGKILEKIICTLTFMKHDNVTPIFKKGDKQFIKNYNNLITKNHSGFRPGDSTTNQLLYLVDEIHQAFDSTKSLEVRTVFLDISKAFDKI